MAVAFNDAGQALVGFDPSATHTVVANGTDCYVLAMGVIGSSSDKVSSVTCNGVAMVRIRADGLGLTSLVSYVYGLAIGDKTAETQTIVWTFTSSDVGMRPVGRTFNGVNQSSPIADQDGVANSFATSPIAFPSVTVPAGSMTIDYMATNEPTLALTPGTGQTESGTQGSEITHRSAASRESGETAMSWSFTGGGSLVAAGSVIVLAQAGGDTTAPSLSSQTGTGATLTGSGSVSTDEGNGTLWWKVDASATATDPGASSESGAGWTSQTVTATGTQTVASFSTLTSGTKYAHYLHVDSSGNRSGVSNSSAFTVGSGVTFSGTVANQSGITGTSFSLDLSTYFSGNMTRTYAVQSGSLSGSGLSLNSSSGVISGTLATVAIYTVTIRATDTYSDTDDTNSFTITVSASGTAPTVSSNPSNTTVTAGATASFTAAASGSPTPTVQWQENTGSWTNISGQTSTTLSLGVVGTIDSGRVFRAVFTNSSGSATTTSATLTVNAASGDGTITSEPLKRNNGQLLGANTLSWLGFRNASTGADVLVMTSVTVNSSSIFTTGTNAALDPGQLYAINWKTATGEYGSAWANAV